MENKKKRATTQDIFRLNNKQTIKQNLHKWGSILQGNYTLFGCGLNLEKLIDMTQGELSIWYAFEDHSANSIRFLKV